MAEKKKKTAQTCSFCSRTGHNKRTCRDAAASSVLKKGGTKRDSAQKKAKIQQTPSGKKETMKAKGPRTIFVEQSRASSAHVVNLRDEQRKEEWKKIAPYTEKPANREIKQTIDFAALIARANAEAVQPTPQELISKIPAAQTTHKPGGQKPITRQSLRRAIPASSRRLRTLDPFGRLKRFVSETNSNAQDHARRVKEEIRSRFVFVRFAYSVIALLLIVTLPFPAAAYYRDVRGLTDQVAAVSTHAFLSLQSSTVAALHADMPSAQADLGDALSAFEEARSLLEREHYLLRSVAGLLPVVGTEIKSRQSVLNAGHHLALGNTYVLKGVAAAQDEKDALPLTDRFAALRAHLKHALPQYMAALRELSSVEPRILPVELQGPFEEFRILFAAFLNDMQDTVDLIDAFGVLGGQDDLRRYLVVFQNPHEIRATGGFMGSFAVVDIQKGKIQSIDVPGGGTYDVQGQLGVYVKPPTPLQLINKRWEFQDANWFPDFPASAKKMESFFHAAGGPSVDGVIAVNASVLSSLLGVIGPIEVEGADEPLTQENAVAFIQKTVEEEGKKTNAPKAIVGDVIAAVFEKLREPSSLDAVRLLGVINTALVARDIQMSVDDLQVQELLHRYQWTGELRSAGSDQDYLFVVGSNIAGEKSDAMITQAIEHQADVQEDGSIIDTVVVSRTHAGNGGNPLYDANNVNYIRVYVPQGAELLEAGGFTYPDETLFEAPEPWYEDDADVALYEMEIGVHPETGTRITNEFGKTVFGNWMMTPPKETTHAYFRYRLPFTAESKRVPQTGMDMWRGLLSAAAPAQTSRFSILVQKQSGVTSQFKSTIVYPPSWMPVWKSDDDMMLAKNGAVLETVLESDLVAGLVMEKQTSH